MKKVFILHKYSNGHKAFLEFKKSLFINNDYTESFCDTHKELVDKFVLEGGLAVLPIKNSLVGEIKEVTSLLRDLEQKSSLNIKEISRLDLIIQHILAAKEDVELSKITKVFSHEKAIEQCSIFLYKNKIADFVFTGSTSGAAEVVSGSQYAFSAAITTDIAAEHYKLKIISTEIQNKIKNKTTFVLLENIK